MAIITIQKSLLAGADKVKHSLEGLIFVADDFAECEKEVTIVKNGVETKQMQLGKWRLQKSAHLNGLAVLDVDHLTENPVEVFRRWEETQLRELGVLLVLIVHHSPLNLVKYLKRQNFMYFKLFTSIL